MEEKRDFDEIAADGAKDRSVRRVLWIVFLAALLGAAAAAVVFVSGGTPALSDTASEDEAFSVTDALLDSEKPDSAMSGGAAFEIRGGEASAENAEEQYEEILTEETEAEEIYADEDYEDYEADEAGERFISFTRDGISFEMRVPDIYPAYGYADEKYVIADYAVTNNSNGDFEINVSDCCEKCLLIGYFDDYDDDYKLCGDDFFAGCKPYDKESGKVSDEKSVVVSKGGTAEFTLRYRVPDKYLDKRGGIFYCGEFPKDTSEYLGTKYEILGTANPVFEYRFKENESLSSLAHKASANPDGGISETELNIEPLSSDLYDIQTIPADSPAFYFINTEDSPYDMWVEIAAEGDAESNFYADISGYSNVMENESIAGIIPEIHYNEALDVEKVRIMFKIKDWAAEGGSGKYDGLSDEFEGVKRFNVFMYFEDINMQLPIETKFDTENNIVYAETDSMGTYSLVDMEIWFEMLGVEPD